MLVKEAGDLWICSCGNWVGGPFTWCPKCAEDRDVKKQTVGEEGQTVRGYRIDKSDPYGGRPLT